MLEVTQLMELVEAATSIDDLAAAIRAASAQLGFQHFALSHHVDLAEAGDSAIWIHNYPAGWAEYYESHSLGLSDPVHRASHVTMIGFRWSRLEQMIPLTTADRRMLLMSREHGIGDGFTVPAHVPGETRGSVSFATETGRALPAGMLPAAQLVGCLAFEAARRLCTPRTVRPGARLPVLTDRQRECALWVARGKTDWEIACILGLSEETVARHVRQACERYGVSKRTSLVIRALFDGTLTFTDVFSRRYTPFPG
ncbi:LuxR family transcriptional regulator [Novosphingobium endophyticum]|uniref:LuxR family transcriptional regulator n=1 Tax=Novosphingobium endophyticum TaxID=1955250 RepID=A0A916TT04_9SPHN|nr:LuxR family transcriptional regulator [Novosphingobium endophyticum]GGC05008.1 LuxR family transcriptional regulator [Novosphingobium endophyticum]